MAVWPLGRRGLPAWPLSLVAITLVPWLPLPLPAVLLGWAGPLTGWVWAVALVAWLGPRAPRPSARPAAAFLVALAVFGAAAWQLRDARPGGDEPHYLVIVQSLLIDGDLRIENNHERRDYAGFFGGVIRPHFLKRGANGEIYSVHAPGLPAIVAPAFALGGYQAVVALLVLFSALGTVVVWRAAWLLTGEAGAAWFAWATSLAAPFFFHSYAVYPDGLGSVLVATGVLALVRVETGRAMTPARWALHGAALAILPWLHTRFAVAAAVLGACLALRLLSGSAGRGARALLAFLAVPAVSAAGWFGFFRAIWGTFSPTAPYGTYTQTAAANVLRGLPGLLLDQQFGILPNAPVYLCAAAGLWWLGRRRPRLALELTLLVAAYLAAVSGYHMWWGGWSAPARFAVPMMLTLGVASGVCWAEAGRAGRAASLALLALSLLVTSTMTLARGGRLIFNSRDGFARWLDFIAPNVDLPRALPSFFRDGRPLAFAQAAAWFAALGLAVFAIRLVLRRGERHPAAGARLPLAIAVPLIVAVASSGAAAVSWRMAGATALSPLAGQVALLQRYDPTWLPIGLRYGKGWPLDEALVPPELTLRAPRARPAPPEGLLSIGALPAGTYRVERTSSGQREGALVVRLGRDERPLATWSLDASAGEPGWRLDLPAGASALVVEGDEAARAATGELALRVVSVVPPDSRAYRRPARHGAVYDDVAVYAFDDHAWLEGPGLWVRGGLAVPLVISKAGARRLQVRLRNGPTPNSVEIEGGGWRASLPLAAREERTVEVPLRGTPPAALLQVRTATGFRPSETIAGNGDGRFLGVWLEFPR